MSKKNVLSFLSKAAKDKQLKAQLKTTSTPDELVGVGNQAGYEFSSEHVDEVLTELKQKPGFFGALAEAVVEVFSPEHDDYPATGVQPFSGDPNPNP
ncbi:MAG: Nif11-like leader peptide family natural product precursor [Cyanobacteria bacterium P01_G01_bin.38]